MRPRPRSVRAGAAAALKQRIARVCHLHTWRSKSGYAGERKEKAVTACAAKLGYESLPST